jgi:hypothetical protein
MHTCCDLLSQQSDKVAFNLILLLSLRQWKGVEGQEDEVA